MRQGKLEVEEVFIPTKNSARTIKKCIVSIHTAIPKAEVHLIDKFSTDGTGLLAEQLGAKVFRSQMGLGEKRSFICNRAKGETFVMVDSDTYLSEDWLTNIREALDSINDDNWGIIQGLNEPMYERYRSWCRKQVDRTSFPQKNPKRILTCNVLVRTEAARGFTCNLPVYEDYALTNYIREKGFNCYVTDKAKASHDNPTSEFFEARWAGAGAVYTGATSLWKLFAGIFWSGLLKTEWGWKWYAAKLHYNWFIGGLFKKKYLVAKL